MSSAGRGSRSARCFRLPRLSVSLVICAAHVALATSAVAERGAQHAPITALLPPPPQFRGGSSPPYTLESIVSESRSSPHDATIYRYAGGTPLWPAAHLTSQNGGEGGGKELGGRGARIAGAGGGGESIRDETRGTGHQYGVDIDDRIRSRTIGQWPTGPDEVRLLKALLRVFPLAYDRPSWEFRDRLALDDDLADSGVELDSSEMEDLKPSQYLSDDTSTDRFQFGTQNEPSSDYKSLRSPNSLRKAGLDDQNLEQVDPLDQLEEPSVKRGFYDTIAGVRNWWGNTNLQRHRPVVNRRAPESKHYSCIKNCIQGGKLHPIQCHTLC
ncbi:hypothetical protein FHG87_000674 [Trinorchestia longiramus]|nr:hypothetical protein FHG87_000674 [Trinorchestia longiramus]